MDPGLRPVFTGKHPPADGAGYPRVVVQMVSAEDPPLPSNVGDDDAAQSHDVLGEPTPALPQALASSTGLRGALFAQWGRQKRRTALQQRYGEDFGLGGEDDDVDLRDLF